MRYALWMVCTISLLSILTGCFQSQSKKQLVICSWADYVDDDLVRQFEEENDCEVVFDYFESNESLLAKLMAGGGGYDLITPTDYLLPILKQKQMIQKPDHAKIPNIQYIDPAIAEKLGDATCEWSVPYFISLTGIGYRKDAFPTPPDSWRVFGDPQYKNRVTLMNNMRETMGAALITLGYSCNSVDEKELAEARDLLLEWKKNIAKYSVDEVKQGIANGEYYAIHGYNGDILQINQTHPEVDFAIPKEGCIFGGDHFVIPSNANDPDLAMKYINFMTDPKHCAQNMQFVRYTSANSEAIQLLPPEMRDNPMIFFSKDVLDHAEMLQDVGDKTQIISKYWDEVQSGS